MGGLIEGRGVLISDMACRGHSVSWPSTKFFSWLEKVLSIEVLKTTKNNKKQPACNFFATRQHLINVTPKKFLLFENTSVFQNT